MRNRLLLFGFFALIPLFAFSQASGGQIKRSLPQRKVTIKKKQSVSQRQVTNSASTRQSQVVTNKERTKEYIINGIINNMIYVAGGTFIMGGTQEQGGEVEDNEKPVHQVSLSSYYICKYEVTIEEWNTVMGINVDDHSNDRKPMKNISWDECQMFISRLNSLTGKSFRLPTEAEWEYAARGGKNSNNYKYSGSNNYNDVVCKGHSNVGSKRANELGIFDMSGSVYEWCQDIYNLYRSESQYNPKGSSVGENRVIRGGGYLSYPDELRVSHRVGYEANRTSLTLGFRLAL